MSQQELLDKIRALGFAMHEAALFLDTHHDCPAALDYFMRIKEELEELTDEYEENYGALTHGGVSGDTWNWVENEWPWHAGNGAQQRERNK